MDIFVILFCQHSRPIATRLQQVDFDEKIQDICFAPINANGNFGNNKNESQNRIEMKSKNKINTKTNNSSDNLFNSMFGSGGRIRNNSVNVIDYNEESDDDVTLAVDSQLTNKNESKFNHSNKNTNNIKPQLNNDNDSGNNIERDKEVSIGIVGSNTSASNANDSGKNKDSNARREPVYDENDDDCMDILGLLEDEVTKALPDTLWEFDNVTTTADVMFDCIILHERIQKVYTTNKERLIYLCLLWHNPKFVQRKGAD